VSALCFYRRRRDRSSVFSSLALALLVLLAVAAGPGSQRAHGDRIGESLQVAEGILVQPNVGDLEPPSIADENDDPQERDDDSGEEVPVVLERRGTVVVVPPRIPVPEDAEPEINRPDVRQEELERGGRRQEDLETPEGPGIRY